MPDPPHTSRLRLLRNWISLSGGVVFLGGLFAFGFLSLLELAQSGSNPYQGILTYLVAPAFMAIGAGLSLIGAWLRHRQLRRARQRVRLVIDLSRKRDARILAGFAAGLVVFLVLSAIGSYQSYHVVASTAFCGQACHTIVEPEYVTHSHSAHAHVECVECHVGPGAAPFIQSKLSGAYHLVEALLDSFPRPIPTPVQNLRPARDTCGQCHWPRKFIGDLVRKRTHFLSDAANTEYSIRLLMKVGGEHSPAQGIHWHIANQVEYLATDPRRQVIPWVRVTGADGQVTEFRSPGFTNDVPGQATRTMDCLDCHSRPAHRFQKPNEAVDAALADGRIDRSLAFVRSNTTALLVADYATAEEAEQKIAEGLRARYPGEPRIEGAIRATQQVYRDNFFPRMRSDWRAYPEHIGHKDWAGCTRCHDDRHRSADGQKIIRFNDCNQCHLILAQGSGESLERPTLEGQAFEHPGEPYDPGFRCHDCHTGGP